MAEGVQINPRIKLATKVRLEAFRKERGYSQGEVIDAALEAYFSPADGDSQTLLFQKVNSLEQGMKDVVTLLGTVIQHLEHRASRRRPRLRHQQRCILRCRLLHIFLPSCDNRSPSSTWSY